MFDKRRKFSVAVGFAVAVLGFAVVCPAQTCVTDASSDVRICVDWGEVDDPDIGDDFTVDYSLDADNPDIKLLTGSLTWQVWAEDKTNNALPANIGKIWADDAEDYVLFIAEGSYPQTVGAEDVGSILLLPSGTHFSGMASGSQIAGDLTGDLQMIKNASGSGGQGGILIGGELSGNIAAAHGRELTVVGDMSGSVTVEDGITGEMQFEGAVSGSIEVTDKLDGGHIHCDGGVTSAATITIGDMLTYSGATISQILISGTMAGDLVLNEGVPFGQLVKILGTLTSTASVDLKNNDLDGRLELLTGGSGQILNGGALSGILKLGAFSGSATFSSVTYLGDVDAGPLSGLLKITGTVASGGTIDVTGDLASAGDLVVVGAMSGDITVTGDAAGDIWIKGDMNSAGSISVQGELSATGRIFVDGECNGDIIISERTADLSLIRLRDFGSSGNVVVNDSEGDFDAEGDIYVGSVAVLSEPPPPDVIYDGSILLKKESGTSNGGGLLGRIKVVGRHATTDDLDICECGTSPSINVTIIQDECTNQVDWSCVSSRVARRAREKQHRSDGLRSTESPSASGPGRGAR